MTHRFQFTLIDGDGDELIHDLPAKHEVCDRCEGHGTHLNPAIGEHAYTRDEFNESFDDDERAEYFRRGGIYDVQCEQCHGQRVVTVVDERACTSATDKRTLAIYHAQQRAAAEDERTRRAEMRFGY